MLYGVHGSDRAWQQQEELPDEPDPADVPFGPPDSYLDALYEDMQSHWDDDPNPYAGTYSDDADFFETIDEQAAWEEGE